ncbi:spermidine/putrescine ABC transporter substrate-binding protein [Campylobacter pinnipediorum subsp. pinnipediorum]|uniref:Spermidine/putrescine ABC transporter substrate-binding protein n=2 Tax=Campylobacter TaxID=194 RepID=A0AAX0L8M2_9BACT|nr:spermidine/putrescine ABC transporter substrate-binding protein [Campylobacter pinnipediorum subsp. pinnipediorum]OPA75067.1 spermidine/putrescine ABC transporter substrate-binding protein [Campylobacter pinnipediorum subsp. pinnipediorum]
MENIVKTTCPYCGTGCGIDLIVKNGRIIGAQATKDHHINDGELCLKGMFGWEFVNSSKRITKPMIRKKNGVFSKDGELCEVSFDEAYDFVASKFKETVSKYGPNSIMGFSSARSNNEDNYVFQKFFRAQGSNNIDHCARL